MGGQSFTSQLWVLGSVDDAFLGLALTFLPHNGDTCQRPGAEQQPPAQNGDPTSAFWTLSLLWVPSQYGGF